MEKIVGVAQLYFMPHPLLEIVQRLMAHPVLRMFIDKVKNFCDHSMILREMAANQKPIGTL